MVEKERGRNGREKGTNERERVLRNGNENWADMRME